MTTTELASAVRSGARLASIVLILLAATAHADGTGMIGTGKTLYYPTCAFACRNVVSKCTLLCTPSPDNATVNHGTAHNPVTTPPKCFVSDPAFLKTVALCIDNYCPHDKSPPALDVVEDYWARHLGTGTMGTDKWVPVMSYREALRTARGDETTAAAAAVGHGSSNNTTGTSSGSGNGTSHDGHSSHARAAMLNMGMSMPNVSSALPVIKAKKPLNVTSFIVPTDWQLQYNGLYDFETNEIGHTHYAIVIAVVAVTLPVLASLLPRVLPSTTTRSYFWTALEAAVIHPPAWGTKHREPVALTAAVGGALVPTRGQALYIGIISLLNIVLLLGPFVSTHPQSTFVSLQAQSLSVIGNRAGDMAMGNAVAMYTFAMRNNPLSYVTRGWTRSTYLLLHRWLGYWVILHTALHSVLLLAYYKIFGSYEAELVRAYWIWGIVGTVAVCAVFPTSLLVVRQRAYEFFLASHVVLSLLFLVGFYYHIWYCYEYRWGYEIWMFVASALWAVDWVVRAGRVLVQGFRTGAVVKTATVNVVEGTDGGYVRIRVDGVELRDGGFAYLYFPTLGWKFWEGHPFSVASATSPARPLSGNSEGRQGDNKNSDTKVTTGKRSSSSSTSSSTTKAAALSGSTSFFARTQTGMTSQLGKRAAASSDKTFQLSVIVEATYHGGGRPEQSLAGCERLVCIAGGVGVTALLPYLSQHAGNAGSGDKSKTNKERSAQLYWGLRQAGLVEALEPELTRLQQEGGVRVETAVGTRFDVEQILRRELLPSARTGASLPRMCCKGKMAVSEGSAIDSQGDEEEKTKTVAGADDSEAWRSGGPVAIVVCGPPSMADDVRVAVSRLARQETLVRPYVFIDEAFSW
ncbi:hypothetical protein Micbo1qcDRAFT_220768 [Microdochium bolleyi]|uniref:Ferric reductase like transmembrane component-domain-containing protein n=1 Tax=Microdochium bolleyi TaxID=196109 RepID=A0A136JAG9_9PEZI|nr:hypothetical protein Micbo1qcDRAFT_220768 [Microdochium bolleyi]